MKRADARPAPRFSKRLCFFAADFTICALLSIAFTPELGEVTQNRINNELAKSGAQFGKRL